MIYINGGYLYIHKDWRVERIKIPDSHPCVYIGEDDEYQFLKEMPYHYFEPVKMDIPSQDNFLLD